VKLAKKCWLGPTKASEISFRSLIQRKRTKDLKKATTYIHMTTDFEKYFTN